MGHRWSRAFVASFLGLGLSVPVHAFTIQEIVDSLTARYDLIRSYRADADVFQYDG